MKLSKALCFSCSFTFLFIVACSRAVPSDGSGGGPIFNICLQPKTRLLNCNESQIERRFYFDHRQNRCRGYHTCPIGSAVPNVFLTRAECTMTCPAATCTLPEPPRDGNQRMERLDNGAVQLTYTCRSGFTLSGTAVRTCQYNGNWTNETPSCKHGCPRAPAIDNGVKLLETSRSGVVRPGSLVVYGCNSGFQNILQRKLFLVCLPNGAWSGEIPFCGKLVILHNNKEVQKISANDGEGLQVDCVMKPRFPPKSNCTWYYPTVAHVNSSTTWTADKSAYSLRIPTLRPADAGDYNCKVAVSNTVTEKKIEIEVQEIKAPVILTNPQKLFIPPNLDIICVLHGHPKPEVTWFYNNIPLNNISRVSRFNRGCGRNYEIRVTDENIDSRGHTLSVLKICNPTPNDSGKYFCQGANSVGTVNSTSIQITVPAAKKRRSLSAASHGSHPQVEIGALCSSASDPGTGIFVGKVRRHFTKSNSYYLAVDRALNHRSDQLATKKLIRARSSPLPITRQGRYFFAVRTTEREKHLITAVYPYSSVLERVVNICMQQ